MADIPINTRTKVIDWKTLVQEAEDLSKPDESYQFSKKTFYERKDDGPYNDG